MKKIILLLAASLMITTNCIGQNTANQLFDSYKENNGAEYKNLKPILIAFVKSIIKEDSEDTKIVKSIKSVKMLDISKCKPEVKQKYKQDIREFKPQKLELLVQIKEEKKCVNIYGKIKRNKISQLLVVTDNKLIRIKGNFDLEKLTKSSKLKLSMKKK